MEQSVAGTELRSEGQTRVPVTTAPRDWQVVGAVVRGVSHERLGMPCQDAQDYQILPDGTLLVALADGAGSASFSDQGARCAVNQALHSLSGALESGLPSDNEGWQRLLYTVFDAARAAVLSLAQVNAVEEAPFKPAAESPAEPEDQIALNEWTETDHPGPCEEPAVLKEPAVLQEPAAEEGQTAPAVQTRFVQQQAPDGRAYATTLTCAIATAGRLVVGQIGDGVVVAGKGEDLVAVTRLQRGEYANETHFLTQAEALEQLEIAVVEQPVSALAVMSDGLVRLALKMPEQEPHAPFFRPLFRVTAAVAEPGGTLDETEAARQLSAFLGSERVNARTDDDKSLVLAVRVASLRESGECTPTEDRTMRGDSEGVADPGRTRNFAEMKGAEKAPPKLDWEKR